MKRRGLEWGTRSYIDRERGGFRGVATSKPAPLPPPEAVALSAAEEEESCLFRLEELHIEELLRKEEEEPWPSISDRAVRSREEAAAAIGSERNPSGYYFITKIFLILWYFWERRVGMEKWRENPGRWWENKGGGAVCFLSLRFLWDPNTLNRLFSVFLFPK